jgi:hypothetical protein
VRLQPTLEPLSSQTGSGETNMNSSHGIKPGNRITWRHRYDKALQGHIVYRGVQRLPQVFATREAAAAAARQLRQGSMPDPEDQGL